MKIEGKNLFSVKSVNSGKPETKPEIQEAVKWIIELMKMHQISRISL